MGKVDDAVKMLLDIDKVLTGAELAQLTSVAGTSAATDDDASETESPE